MEDVRQNDKLPEHMVTPRLYCSFIAHFMFTFAKTEATRVIKINTVAWRAVAQERERVVR